MAVTRPDLSAPQRGRIKPIHPAVDGRLGLRHRQPTPARGLRSDRGIHLFRRPRGPGPDACAPRSLTPGDTRSHRCRTPQPAAAANHATHAPPSTDARPPPATCSEPRPPRQPPHPNCPHTTAPARPTHQQPTAPPTRRPSQPTAARMPRSPPAPTPPPHRHQTCPRRPPTNDSNINSTIFSQTDRPLTSASRPARGTNSRLGITPLVRHDSAKPVGAEHRLEHRRVSRDRGAASGHRRH